MTNTASKAFAIMTHRRTESEKTRTTHTKLIGRHFLFLYFILFFIFFCFAYAKKTRKNRSLKRHLLNADHNPKLEVFVKVRHKVRDLCDRHMPKSPETWNSILTVSLHFTWKTSPPLTT